MEVVKVGFEVEVDEELEGIVLFVPLVVIVVDE